MYSLIFYSSIRDVGKAKPVIEMVVISVEPWEKEKEEPNDTKSVHSSQTSQGMLFGFQDLASDYFQVRFWVENFFP